MNKVCSRPRILSPPLWVVVLTGAFLAGGCFSDPPDEPEDTVYSVCCETDQGTEYVSNVDCSAASGAQVPIAQCETICCDQLDGSYAWIAPTDCASDGGISSFPGHCADVCCAIEGQVPQVMLQGSCGPLGGTEVAMEECSPQEDICCRYAAGGFALVPLAACQSDNGSETTASNCDEVCCGAEGQSPSTILQGDCDLMGGTTLPIEACAPPTGDVCCKNPNGNGPEIVPADQCEADQVQPDEVCEPVVEDVCCEGSAGYSYVPSDECDPANVVPNENCDGPILEACCKTPQGLVWLPLLECNPNQVQADEVCERPFCCKIMQNPGLGDAHYLSWPDCLDMGGTVLYEGYCEQEICCDTDDGPQLMPFVDCTFLQLTQTSDCTPEPEDSCCKIMDGPGAGNAFYADATGCAEQNGAFVPEEYCTQELCCNTDDGPQLMPYFECTFLQLTVTSDCAPPNEEQCCKLMDGPGLGNAFMATPEDCVAQNGAILFQEYCDQVLCCDTADGPQLMPFMECTFLQLLTTVTCTPEEEEQCCKISFGVDTGNVIIATPSDCAEQGGIITVQEYCEQTVCCDTAAGPQSVPFLDCPFLSVTEVGDCTPAEEDECCLIYLGPETGNVSMTTQTSCALQNGIIVGAEVCDQAVCCDMGDSFAQVLNLYCPFLSIVEDEQCVEPEVDQCCKIFSGPDTGNVLMATQSDCEALSGIITTQDYCDQLMCCNTDVGPQYVPFLECAFADLNWVAGACDPEPQLVCCQDGPLPSYITEEACDEQGGFVLGDDCSICCAQGAQTSYITASECAADTGTIVGPTQCQVCCQFQGGAEEVPAEFCLAGGGSFVDDSVCNLPPDEMICCQVGEENEYILNSQCNAQNGTLAAPSACQVCCALSGDGNYQTMPATFCIAALGSIVDDGMCEEPDEMVCCQVGEETSHILNSQCTGQSGTTVDLQECKICCKNPNGNGPEYVFEEDCDAVNPDSNCEPPSDGM